MVNCSIKDLKTCLCYLYDVVICSSSFTTHLDRLHVAVTVLPQGSLQLNSSKYRFSCRQHKILRHVIKKHVTQPIPDKISAVSHFPSPIRLQVVRSFLEVCLYFRRFIDNFATIARPIATPFNKETVFSWLLQLEDRISILKTSVTPSSILGHYGNMAPMEPRTNASRHGIGPVLAQSPSGIEHVSAYTSRLLTPGQCNYAISELEFLAFVWLVTEFHFLSLEKALERCCGPSRPLLLLIFKRSRWPSETLGPSGVPICHNT